MKMHSLGITIVLTLTALAAGSFAADGVPETGTTGPDAKAAMDLAAAMRMASIGRETKAPEALLAAARVIGRTNCRKLEPADPKAEHFQAFDPLKEATALLSEAKALGDQNEGVKVLIAAVQDDIRQVSRGAEGGPRVINGSVREGEDRRDTFNITFKGGEQAFVIVRNRTNRGDIDLYVEDDNGRIIARDTRRDDDARVSFFVPRRGTYQVQVRCFSGPSRALHYTLVTD